MAERSTSVRLRAEVDQYIRDMGRAGQATSGLGKAGERTAEQLVRAQKRQVNAAMDVRIAEERLKEIPVLIKAPSGYPQQSPWLSIANKQLEIMGRYMAELGLSPAARQRVSIPGAAPGNGTIVFRWMSEADQAEETPAEEANLTITHKLM